MDELGLRIQARTFKALAHPTRLAILEMMRDGDICSGEIEPKLGLRQPNIAQHLAVLRDSQLVRAYRDGSRVMYGVSDSRVFRLLDIAKLIMRGVLEETTQSLAAGGKMTA
jgi:DNA-binding transcriptional ArsR family regulator